MKLALRALFAALLGALALSAGAQSSGAVFVAASPNAASTVTAAADFNTVAVLLADPGTPLHGTVALSATASSQRGVASVTFQVAPAGSNGWQTLCSATTAPYTCSFDTTTVPDSLRDLRAVATDAAGYSRVSVVSSRLIDNGAPASHMNDPGTPLKGLVTVSATGADGGSGLASLTIQRRPSAGGTWTAVCTSATSPLSCSLDTTAVADGLWDLRAVSVDAAGNSSTDSVTSRRVDNTAPTVALTDPGTLSGSVTLASTPADAGTGVASVLYQYRPTGNGAWTTACASVAGPWSCSFATGALTDGQYDLRATATDAGGLSTASSTVTRWIDNTAPSAAAMTDPGSPLSGIVNLSGTAADAGSGVATMRFQSAPTGTTSWTTACTGLGSPFGCSWDTTTLADGVYDLRAVAYDAGGNPLASATRAARRVDNLAPTVSLTDPGTPLRATKTLTATASDGGGIASVVIERKPSAGSTWTTICTKAAAPYTCSWTTTGVADGAYDLRATATDNAGRTSSSTVAARTVDNTPLSAASLTSTNSGTAGTLSTGDTLDLTYSEPPAPSSILSGWTGTSRSVTLSFTTAVTTTSFVATDVASGAIVSLGTVTIADKLTKSTGTVFAGTMVLTGSTLTLTLGTTADASNLKAGANPMALSWTVPATVTDVAGNGSAANTVTGSGNL